LTELAATSTRATAPAIDRRLVDILLAVFVGGAAFLAIVGPQVLDISNIGWLAQEDDSFTHYLGWEFFRRSPWTWPPGLNPDYGLQFSSSIVFSDSVPLLALALKPFSTLMPPIFQYTGWWILACFVLQAYFAARIGGLFTRDAVVKLALATLLTFAPPMLWRLSVHYSLIPHWIILAAIYLYFAPNSRSRWTHWVLLLGASALIHTYLFAMCVPIWLVSLLRRRGGDDRRTASPHWLVEIIAGFGVAALALVLAGFFPLRSDMLSWGYGYFRMNVLSFVNPDGSMNEGEPWTWSALLPGLAHVDGDYEGFAYAGLGSLAVLVLAFPLLLTERRGLVGHRIWPLAIVAVLLTLFAISPNMVIGDRAIVIPMPGFVMDLAGAMRSSGRFFWPVYYLLPLGAVWLVHRGFGDRISGVLLLLLAALQVYDTYPGWSALRPHFEAAERSYQTSLEDPELAAVASHYNAVRMLPAGNASENWGQVAWFGLNNGKPTDATYLARPDDDGYTAYMARIDWAIAAHALDADALYFVNREYAARIAPHLSAEDAMFEIGDFYVFAPGWTRFGVSTPLKMSTP
jgi:hypothetical protein